MIELVYGKKFTRSIVLALGFFDCIHIGHRKIIGEALEFANKNNCICAVTTFENSPFTILNSTVKLIYTYEERLLLLNKLGVDAVLKAEFNNEFKNISAKEYLSSLKDNFYIKHIVCGYDYRFGKEAEGDTAMLKTFCSDNGISLSIIPKTIWERKKISSTLIREYLLKGDLQKVNMLLDSSYFIKGNVVHGRNIGSKMLYPTVNIELCNNKMEIKSGVYATVTQIEGKNFLSVTNCGEKPTFENNAFNIETYILDYKGDLYGKTIYIYFNQRLRDTIKFENVKQLKEQISKDILYVKGIEKESFIGEKQ